MHPAARSSPSPPAPQRGSRAAIGLLDAGSPLWLASAARTWHAEPDEHAVARSVSRSVAELLPASVEVTVTLLGPGHRPLRAVDSAVDSAVDPAAAAAWLDAVQLRAGEGPLPEALAGEAAAGDDLRTAPWPVFGRAALDRGVRSAVCLPLQSGSRVLGALAVYSPEPADWSGAGTQLLEPVAAHAALALAAVQRAVHLDRALESRDVIGQAKGVLMERYRITADAAFGILARASQDTHRRVREVAALVTETGETPRQRGGAGTAG